MHLSFDTIAVKQGDNKVQDDSGNKNDAALANGAEISNRTMGKTCSTSWTNFFTLLNTVKKLSITVV